MNNINTISRPDSLVHAAQEAGIDVPPNHNDYDHNKYYQWHIFCLIQLDRPLKSSKSHYINAKIVAEKCNDATSYNDLKQLME